MGGRADVHSVTVLLVWSLKAFWDHRSRFALSENGYVNPILCLPAGKGQQREGSRCGWVLVSAAPAAACCSRYGRSWHLCACDRDLEVWGMCMSSQQAHSKKFLYCLVLEGPHWLQLVYTASCVFMQSSASLAPSCREMC